jgi:heme/copper-type cytochrome/quinol oxidase subunit 2
MCVVFDGQEFGSDNILTKGPLMVTIEETLMDFSEEQQATSVDSTMIYLGVSLGFVLAVLGVVVGSIIRKRKTQTDKLAKLESERRLTGQKFTREAF